MKTAKLCVTLSMLLALPAMASAQISPYVSAQVDAAARPCSDLAGASAGLPEARARAIAMAALGPCYEALKTLDMFEKVNGAGMTPDERNYFYYVGGNVIWITAASEVMKNNGRLSVGICEQVKAAEASWGNVRVPENSEIDIEMQTNDLRRMLLPACTQAR